MSAAVSAVLVGGAVLLYLGPSAGLGRRDLSLGVTRRRSSKAIVVAGIAAGAIGTIALAGGPAAALDVLGLVGIAMLVGWLVHGRRSETARRRRHQAVVGLCGALAAELQAGLAAESALTRACADWPEFVPVERMSRVGGDVPSALRSLAGQPGFEGLRSVAAGWAVAERSGASLAAVLDRIGDGLRDEGEAHAETESALAPPRATARMLAVLPGFGVLLGTAMGAQPVAFLLGTSAGQICLLAGALLALAGVAWVERLAKGAGTA